MPAELDARGLRNNHKCIPKLHRGARGFDREIHHLSVLRRPRLLRRSLPGSRLVRDSVSSSSRRGPARRSLNFSYEQRHVCGVGQSVSGNFGAWAARNRDPFKARAAAQLAPVDLMATACQGFF